MEEDTPNFYILLGLNPEKWDAKEFDRVLKEKHDQWSSESAFVGPKARAAQKYLALIPEIERVMRHLPLRASQAEEARKILSARIQESISFPPESEEVYEFEAVSQVNAYSSVLEPDVQPAYSEAADIEDLTVQRPDVQPARPEVTDIEELTVQNLATALRLHWIWPARCQEVRIYHSSQEWPQPERGIGTITTVTRAEYEIGGHYDLSFAAGQPYYLVVTAVLRHDGGYTLSPGQRRQGYLYRKMKIQYEIKNPRFGYKQRTLHLSADVPGTLPTLLLVIKSGGWPLHKTDGELFHREEGPIHIFKEKPILLPDTVLTNTFGRLFLDDDSLYSVVAIAHPPVGKLRLGK